MSPTAPNLSAVEVMPRGGPDASWLSRRLETDVLEYTDRYDVPDKTKQYVIAALDQLGTRTGTHQSTAQLALECVAGIDGPRILELGAGHGRLSEHILNLDPNARVTVSDLDPTSVANVAAGPLGQNPRARTKVIDATAIDETDKTYDLVVFANAFHHLPPPVAVAAIAEATRVGTTFLIVDLKRLPAPAILAFPVFALLSMPLMVRPLAAAPAMIHDGFISTLRSYSPSAFTALGKAANPAMQIEFLPTKTRRLPSVAVAFRRPDSGIR
jgi:2-polyprenyl-3-methyl-5-hydroxy-6-metoxy-1,4-benzoquinol methylase